MCDNKTLFQQLNTAITNHTPCVLATLVASQHSTSGNVGDKAIIFPDCAIQGWVGGGCVQGVIKKVAAQVLQENAATFIRVCPPAQFVTHIPCYPSHCASEGSVDLFLEPIANQPSLLLYGSSPIAVACAQLTQQLDFSLHWHATDSAFAQLTHTTITRITELDVLPSTPAIAIVATQGSKDLAALHSALRSEARHILLVASAKKAQSIIAELTQQGFDHKQLDKIRSPAGLEIGAVGAKEIALAILAQVLSLKNINHTDHLGHNTKVASINTAENTPDTTSINKPVNPSTTGCCGAKT